VLENGLLRRIFRRKRDEVTRKWRKLNNGDLNFLLTNIFRVIKSREVRLAWHVARMGERRGVYRVFMGKHDGTRPLGRPRR